MTKSLISLSFLLMICLLTAKSVDAGRLEDKYGEAFRDVPDTLVFDCSSSAGITYRVFDRSFRAPAQFQANSDGTFFGWDIQMSDGLFTIEYSAIRVYRFEEVARRTYARSPVSSPTENALGAHVVLDSAENDDRELYYYVHMAVAEEVLSISSMSPIDWESLIDCFVEDE